MNKSFNVFQANLENLREQFSCAEDNLNTKRTELEEKTQMIDSMQEKILEITAELATYKSSTDTSKYFISLICCLKFQFAHLFLHFSDKKGNSLFAEVDDQRQKMKDILAAQKQQYLKVNTYFFFVLY